MLPEPFLVDFVKKNLNVSSSFNIFKSISFKLGMMIDTSKLCMMLRPAEVTLTFIWGHSCIRKQKVLTSSQLSQLILKKFGMLLQTINLVKLVMNLSHN